jgi:hypothetical protein
VCLPLRRTPGSGGVAGGDFREWLPYRIPSTRHPLCDRPHSRGLAGSALQSSEEWVRSAEKLRMPGA